MPTCPYCKQHLAEEPEPTDYADDQEVLVRTLSMQDQVAVRAWWGVDVAVITGLGIKDAREATVRVAAETGSPGEG